MTHAIIQRFLNAIEESFEGMDPRTTWPLNSAQFDSYFEVSEALDMYYRLNKLKEEKSVKEIARIMPPADVIRIFLQHSAIIGLKVAKNFEIENINTEDRVKFTLLLFDILKEKVRNDIFCLDGKNVLMDQYEVDEVLENLDWDKPIGDDHRKVASLTVTSNNLCYTLYFDPYMTAGFYIHGPYDVSKKFGEGTVMLVRDYHDINPKDIWDDLNMPYKKMRIYAVYKGLDIKMNFVNHPVTKMSIADKLIAFKIFLDDEELSADRIDEVIELFQNVASKQTKKVNALPDLDKVRKGAEIVYYMFKGLRESMGDDWKPPEIIEEVIGEYGDQFIKQFKSFGKNSGEHWRRLFDPRDDWLPLSE